MSIYFDPPETEDVPRGFQYVGDGFYIKGPAWLAAVFRRLWPVVELVRDYRCWQRRETIGLCEAARDQIRALNRSHQILVDWDAWEAERRAILLPKLEAAEAGLALHFGLAQTLALEWQRRTRASGEPRTRISVQTATAAAATSVVLTTLPTAVAHHGISLAGFAGGRPEHITFIFLALLIGGFFLDPANQLARAYRWQREMAHDWQLALGDIVQYTHPTGGGTTWWSPAPSTAAYAAAQQEARDHE